MGPNTAADPCPKNRTFFDLLPNTDFSQILTHFRAPPGILFSLIFVLLFVPVIWNPPASSAMHFWARFGLILGPILAPFGGSRAKVKIELPSRRELNFQGSRPFKFDTFSTHFLVEPPGFILVAFSPHLASSGVRLGHPSAAFLRHRFSLIFASPNISRKHSKRPSKKG